MHALEVENSRNVGRMTDNRSFVRCGAEIEYPTEFLDQVIPLRGASHSDVHRYLVEIPMRYAECVALLKDGRKVGLIDRRGFVGWSGDTARCSYLFRKNVLHIELRTDSNQNVSGTTPGNICNIVINPAIRTTRVVEDCRARRLSRERIFIGIDGGQIMLPGATPS